MFDNHNNIFNNKATRYRLVEFILKFKIKKKKALSDFPKVDNTNFPKYP